MIGVVCHHSLQETLESHLNFYLKQFWDSYLLTYKFESHWAPHSFGLVPHQSKSLCKLHKHLIPPPEGYLSSRRRFWSILVSIWIRMDGGQVLLLTFFVWWDTWFFFSICVCGGGGVGGSLSKCNMKIYNAFKSTFIELEKQGILSKWKPSKRNLKNGE